MFSLKELPSSSTLFSAYASFTGSMMLVRSMANELLPQSFQSYVLSSFNSFFTPKSTLLILTFDEHVGMIRNQVYDAAVVYLRSKINPSVERLRVGKVPKEKTFVITVEKGEEIADFFDGVEVKWRFNATEDENRRNEKRYFELSFDKKFKNKVLDLYLPFVLNESKEISQNEKVAKLFARDIPNNDDYGQWGSINLEHPSTFEKLAMDPSLKKMIIDDLDRFVKRREFYNKVGKAWKRGYLLYGPPGTGKSSLIAAMANYLNFDIYDLELSSIYNNADLKRVLVSTTNRSILVIEDIDCSIETDGGDEESGRPNTRLTLSGLLNFLDGLWSSCGDERIFVFTTNYKDRLDPALLRPGRMDVHIHMSYCTFQGIKILASNYLSIQDHKLFEDIEGLVEDTKITPAEVAEEFMRSEDATVALEGLLKSLKRKRCEVVELKNEATIVDETEVRKSLKITATKKKVMKKNGRTLLKRRSKS